MMVWWSGELVAPDRMVAAGLLAGMALTTLVGVRRGYDHRRLFAGGHEYRTVVRAGWMWASLLLAVLYFGQVEVPATYVTGAVVGSLGVLLAMRAAARSLVRTRRHQGLWQRRTLLVGDPEHLSYLSEQFRGQPHQGFDVVGLCATGEAPGWVGTPILGDVRHAAQVIAEHRVQVVVVAASCMDALSLRRFCWEVERHGVELLIAPNIEEVSAARVGLRPVSGTSLLHMAVGQSRLQRAAKGAIDRVLGSAMLLVALPVLGVAALLVRVTSPGSPFYQQTRMGLDGSTFTMLKLRTMYTDADKRRAELLARSDGNEVLFKMRDDPRITPVGRWLRRFSIDELPQLWNVVRGDMSLVGPRPPLPEEVAEYDQDARQRLRAKPGLTGLWQVSGRSDLDWQQSVRLDLNYVDNRSLAMDAAILGRTFRAVFGGRGAY